MLYERINRLANTYSSNRRSCSCRCPHPGPRFFSARASRSQRFSGRIANRRRSSKTWDFRDSSLPTRGDTPCHARYRVSGILWTRDRALAARFLVYPVQQQSVKMYSRFLCNFTSRSSEYIVRFNTIAIYAYVFQYSICIRNTRYVLRFAQFLWYTVSLIKCINFTRV